MKSKKKDKNIDKFLSPWESALLEAKRQIATAENHIRQLRESVGIIERKIKIGEPWPGEEKQDAATN